MCEPTSIIMGLGLALGAAGTAVAVKAKGDEADAAREIADRNAAMAKRAATYATARGEQEAGLAQAKLGAAIGQQRAAIGASGADVQSGSPAQALASNAAIGKLDVEQIRSNAAMEAWGLKAQASNIQLQSAFAQQRARNEQWATALGGIGGLASGSGSLLGRLYDRPKAGG